MAKNKEQRIKNKEQKQRTKSTRLRPDFPIAIAKKLWRAKKADKRNEYV
jgi:hypothetical protein